MVISPLQKFRYSYQPKLPAVLAGNIDSITPQKGNVTSAKSDERELKALFPNTYGLPTISFVRSDKTGRPGPLNIGVILSGGQAPGGHNVICGLYDAMTKADPASILYGFLGGPSGLTDDKYTVLDGETIDRYRNTGGFDIIGSGRTKLETEEQFEKARAVCHAHNINGIVIIGGDDSNTNAAVLAEYFASKGEKITVVGCPKTIDGDLKNEQIEASFGFDTATKVYSELIGNIERDANSAKKYWHFIRLMGRSASHIALECALQTQPNVCLIGEEVSAKKMGLAEVAEVIVDSVVRRAEKGMNFGVALIPEGIIEFIPEVGELIDVLNDLMAAKADELAAIDDPAGKAAYVRGLLDEKKGQLFDTFPESIRQQLVMDRDPHGNVQVSLIETEKLLAQLVKKRLAALKKEGKYNGKFSSLCHFFGYEGRCSFPSNFDADYCYSLGYNAYLLVCGGFSGYLSSVTALSRPASEWKAGGVPITMMMNLENRKGHLKPVIRKALVDLDGAPFKALAANREKWAVETCYTFPGAIQYAGPSEVCDRTTATLALEHGETF